MEVSVDILTNTNKYPLARQSHYESPCRLSNSLSTLLNIANGKNSIAVLRYFFSFCAT
jgi:16S rRNA C1402 (ribose-2'-O) methylase RsmI